MRDRVDWNKCTCHKAWRSGRDDDLVEIRPELLEDPVITKLEPNCPEQEEPEHPSQER